MPKILIVENELMADRLLQQAIDPSHELVFVRSATQALEVFTEVSPDLCLINQRLPDFSGFALVKEIDKVRPDIPKIVMSAFCTKVNVKTAERLGCFALFDKRYILPDLNTTIRAAFLSAASKALLATTNTFVCHQ